MNTKTISINKHIAQLPFKYAVRSVVSFLHRDSEPSNSKELIADEGQFSKYIEVTMSRSDKS